MKATRSCSTSPQVEALDPNEALLGRCDDLGLIEGDGDAQDDAVGAVPGPSYIPLSISASSSSVSSNGDLAAGVTRGEADVDRADGGLSRARGTGSREISSLITEALVAVRSLRRRRSTSSSR